MSTHEILEQLIRSYERYYDIHTDSNDSPFSATAEFHSHNEQYFLVRSAHIADIDTNEYVFFALSENLDEKSLLEFSELSWETGLSKINPVMGHKNSDITLVIVSEKIDEVAANLIKKITHHKSYKLGFYGWSNFRLIAMEASSGNLFSNRLGKDLKKLFTTINKNVSLE